MQARSMRYQSFRSAYQLFCTPSKKRDGSHADIRSTPWKRATFIWLVSIFHYHYNNFHPNEKIHVSRNKIEKWFGNMTWKALKLKKFHFVHLPQFIPNCFPHTYLRDGLFAPLARGSVRFGILGRERQIAEFLDLLVVVHSLQLQNLITLGKINKIKVPGETRENLNFGLKICKTCMIFGET